jgi:beta-N-acetylhexosaminidase
MRASTPVVPHYRLRTARRTALVAVLLLVTALLGRQPTAREPELPAAAERWVEQTLRSLSLEEKLGQLVMVHYYGGFTHAASESYRELLQRIESQHIGGIVVATRAGALGTELSQVYPTAVLTNQMQRRAKIPLLVAADFERGTAMRIAEGTSFPFAMAVAAGGDPQDAYEVARITAIEARAVGVHWNFAPVADVNSNPQNPIINTRSFGEDPRRVAEYVAAFIRGSEENGVLATAKHFPGHGDTSEDSHIGLPVIRGDRARLERVELVPFRAAIAAGVSTIMTGHLAVPALEPDPELPATMSRRILSELLRGELGFRGLIVTDALTMGGVTARYAPGDVAVRALEAGADLLLVPPVPDAALLGLRRAVEQGRLSQKRIDESVRRILVAKARLGLHRQREVDVDALNQIFGRAEFRARAQEIADRGITLLRDRTGLLPLDATQPLRVLLVAVAGDPDPLPASVLEQELRWRVERLQVVRTDTRWVPVGNIKLPPSDSYDVAIAALFVRLADRKGHVSLPPEQIAFVNELLSTGKPIVVAAFGSPYVVERFPNAGTWVAAFSTHGVAQAAVARALFGQVAVAGKFPVTVPGVVQPGEGLTLAARPMTLAPAAPELETKMAPVFTQVEQLVDEGRISGAALAIGHRNQQVVRGFGRTSFGRGAPPVERETPLEGGAMLRGIALILTTALLVEDGLLDLQAPVARYLPDATSGANLDGLSNKTLWQLLLDAGGGSGPPAGSVSASSWPTERSSLLGQIIEAVSGKAASELFADRVLRPLGIEWQWAPTRPAHASPGPSQALPYAGVSAAATQVAPLAQMLLNGGLYGHRRILKRSTIELFTARQRVGDAVRALGWNVAPWNGGTLSRRAYGYDDPRGASLWMDPEKNLFVLFLPAEVQADVEETLRALRDELHRSATEALGLAGSAR